ncbi:hypothetical protein AB5I41_25785 [Sphingomonas sp. MMS24-JH45]
MTALKTPPTRIGRHTIGSPSSAASGCTPSIRRQVTGDDTSKKNSIITGPSPDPPLAATGRACDDPIHRGSP